MSSPSTSPAPYCGGAMALRSPLRTGFTLKIPAGAIDAEYLGVYIEEMPPSDIVVPESSEFIVGSHAGDFAFTDNSGDPIPGFNTKCAGPHLPADHPGRPRYGRWWYRRCPRRARGAGRGVLPPSAGQRSRRDDDVRERRSLFNLLCGSCRGAVKANACANSNR